MRTAKRVIIVVRKAFHLSNEKKTDHAYKNCFCYRSLSIVVALNRSARNDETFQAVIGYLLLRGSVGLCFG
jgi:hypothetical protein